MPARAFTALGALALLAALFLPWYDAGFTIALFAPGDPEAIGGTLSAWEAFAAADVLLATLALATIAFAFRRFPGPATVFAALAAVVVTVKLVWRPDDFGTSHGVWVALAAALAALVAARGISGRA